MYKILPITLLFALLLAVPVQAQTDELPDAGSTPAHPLYFAERFFEGVGVFFTFNREAKAERYLSLARERLSEARKLAEEGDSRATRAVARYETQLEKAQERAVRNTELKERIANNTTHHITVLEEVLERVPEEAQEAIEQAKERSLSGHQAALRALAEEDPEGATEALDRATEARLDAIERRLNQTGATEEEIEQAIEQYDQYLMIRNEMPSNAAGENQATEARMQHMEALEAVRERVPEEAQDAIDRVLEHAEDGSMQPPPTRNLPSAEELEAQQEQMQDQQRQPMRQQGAVQPSPMGVEQE